MRMILVLLSLVRAVFSATPQLFQTTVIIHDDPAVSGSLSAVMSYDASSLKLRTDYSVGPKEVIDYPSRARFLYCSTSQTCEASDHSATFPVFYRQPNDSASSPASATINGVSCFGWTKPNAAGPTSLATVFVDATGFPCRGVFANGRTVDFNVVPSSNATFLPGPGFATPTLLANASNSWGCPPKVCSVQMDLVLVIDESGSIAGSDFTKAKQFATQLVDAYQIGPAATRVGLVMFSSSARTVFSLQTDEATITRSISGLRQLGGSTCIGCGIRAAYNMLIQNSRPSATPIIILQTDGQNNVGSPYPPVALCRNATPPVIIFTIGVGRSVDVVELREIATPMPGVQSAFLAANYSALNSTVASILGSVCSDYSNFSTPCQSCKGFCGCQGSCLCPDVCQNGEICTRQGQCTPGIGGSGCDFSQPVDCDDGDYCTLDSCSSTGGCQHTPVVCQQTDACFVPTCDPSVGCVNRQAVNCTDNDWCTVDSCNRTTGCVHTQMTPAQCDICRNVTCPPIDGDWCQPTRCVATGLTDYVCVAQPPVTCNDGNPCSNDTCIAATGQCSFTPVNCDDGNACTVDFCDPNLGGCQYETINATLAVDAGGCNDGNPCTTDTCDDAIGCVHTNVTCPSDACQTAVCVPQLGSCLSTQTDCSFVLAENSFGDCYEAQCTVQRGCYLAPAAGYSVDACGNCLVDGQPKPVCFVGLNTAGVVGLGVGALAAIIVVVVVVVLASLAVGGGFGYKYWMSKRGTMGSALSNPIYEESKNQGTNPLYLEGESKSQYP